MEKEELVGFEINWFASDREGSMGILYGRKSCDQRLLGIVHAIGGIRS